MIKMSIASKIKSALAIAESSQVEIGKALGISTQAVRMKIFRNSFSATDLVKIAEAINGKLIIKINEQEIVFSAEDVAEKPEE